MVDSNAVGPRGDGPNDEGGDANDKGGGYRNGNENGEGQKEGRGVQDKGQGDGFQDGEEESLLGFTPLEEVGWTHCISQIGPVARNYTIPNLHPGTTYVFRVVAVNEAGYSPPLQLTPVVITQPGG